MGNKANQNADMNGLSKREIANLYEQDATREVEASADDTLQKAEPESAPTDFAAVSTLRALIELSPFTNFVIKQAIIRYTHKTVQGRIMKFEEDHKWVAGFCHIADLFLRLLFTTLLVVVVLLVIYKTIAPLPSL